MVNDTDQQVDATFPARPPTTLPAVAPPCATAPPAPVSRSIPAPPSSKDPGSTLRPLKQIQEQRRCVSSRPSGSVRRVAQQVDFLSQEKFDKYWKEYSMVLSFGVVLDPTKKLNYIGFTYSKMDPNNFEDKVERVKVNLYRLYAEYVKNSGHSNTPHGQSHVSSQATSPHVVGAGVGRGMPPINCVDEEFEAHERTKTISAGKSELDIYLEEDRIPASDGFDILAYWKRKSSTCHALARMACDILSIPITIVASESAFSIGSRVLNKYRSSLKDESIQTLLCTHSWLDGFVEFDGEDNDGERDAIVFEDTNLSQATLT